MSAAAQNVMHLPSHQLAMTVLMTPDTANFSGKVHGGTILKLLDPEARQRHTAAEMRRAMRRDMEAVIRSAQ